MAEQDQTCEMDPESHIEGLVMDYHDNVKKALDAATDIVASRPRPVIGGTNLTMTESQQLISSVKLPLERPVDACMVLMLVTDYLACQADVLGITRSVEQAGWPATSHWLLSILSRKWEAVLDSAPAGIHSFNYRCVYDFLVRCDESFCQHGLHNVLLKPIGKAKRRAAFKGKPSHIFTKGSASAEHQPVKTIQESFCGNSHPRDMKTCGNGTNKRKIKLTKTLSATFSKHQGKIDQSKEKVEVVPAKPRRPQLAEINMKENQDSLVKTNKCKTILPKWEDVNKSETSVGRTGLSGGQNLKEKLHKSRKSGVSTSAKPFADRGKRSVDVQRSSKGYCEETSVKRRRPDDSAFPSNKSSTRNGGILSESFCFKSDTNKPTPSKQVKQSENRNLPTTSVGCRNAFQVLMNPSSRGKNVVYPKQFENE